MEEVSKVAVCTQVTGDTMVPLHRLFNNLHVRVIPKPAARPTLNSMQCQFTHHRCSRPKMEGYMYCERHILCDKNAPYKQCEYIYPGNNRKCHGVAHRDERKGLGRYCSYHTRVKRQASMRTRCRAKPPVTVETLLNSLTHYVPKVDEAKSGEEHKEEQEVSVELGEKENIPVTHSLDPFALNAAQLMDKAGEPPDHQFPNNSDSDQDVTVAEQTLRVDDMQLSDAESVDGAMDDSLKHAVHYTAEEVALIARDKMVRLQGLYIGQLNRLQHRLVERRREYLQEVRQERESLASIHDQPKQTPAEQKLYNKLKAYNRYHKRSGVESVLRRKLLERRAQFTNGGTAREPYKLKCAYTDDGGRCGQRLLPSSKYCLKHITKDPNQLLFTSCGYIHGDFHCKETVDNIFEPARCVFHKNMSTPVNYGSCGRVKERPTVALTGPFTTEVADGVISAMTMDVEEARLSEDALDSE